MDLSLDKIDLNVSSMLINWGLMVGQYEDGVIRKTKFGQFNMAFAFTLFTFEAIKFTILMFCPEESQMAIYLGEFAQYFGPKVVVDFILVAESVNSIILISIFYFLSDKMLFWLDHMQFDRESRFFKKLNLSVVDSEKFTKRFALLWFIIKRVNYFLVITIAAIFGSFLIFKHDYYFWFGNSVVIFNIGTWYSAHHWFSLTLVLYQANNPRLMHLCFFNTLYFRFVFISI